MKKWTKNGNTFRLDDISTQIKELPVGVYSLEQSLFGFYLNRIEDSFEFNYKLYGLEESLINRIVKTWEKTDKNLGALLNGLKGTGKTVTSKVICNKINLPVILINKNFDGGGIPEFLNSINQEVTVFIDEYEKIFGDDAELLTIMDGVLTGTSRKLFLLTTNDTHINANLLQRPGRIRYNKQFNDLEPTVIAEIVDDLLLYPEFREDTISTISNLQVITIDIVKAVIEEANIHNESPKDFVDVFNVKKITGKYNVYQLIENREGKMTEKLLETGVKIYPREFDEAYEGYGFETNGKRLGTIEEVISFDTITVKPDRKNAKSITVRITPFDSIHQNFRYQEFVF